MSDVKCQFPFVDRGCTCASDPDWISRFMDRLASVLGDEAVYGPDDEDDEQAEE